jgi:hypothetical protein
LDYPKNLREFDRLFAHKDACLRFLERVRWGEDFRCQRCGSREYWTLSTGLRRCRGCRFKNSVKTGTIFESSRLPLKMWFYAIWWITAQKSGVSAVDLQKDVGLGSYRSAWLLLHKIRSAMFQADRSQLEGHVEVDLTELGSGKRHLLVIAAEFTGPKTIGRIRIERIQDIFCWKLESFLEKSVAKGSTIYTNGYMGSSDSIQKLGFKHLSGRPSRALPDHLLPRVHIVSEQLRHWLKHTLHGRVDAKHVESYLEEFVFRFNRRSANARELLFQRVIENSVRVEPNPYRKIVRREA